MTSKIELTGEAFNKKYPHTCPICRGENPQNITEDNRIICNLCNCEVAIICDDDWDWGTTCSGLGESPPYSASGYFIQPTDEELAIMANTPVGQIADFSSIKGSRFNSYE